MKYFFITAVALSAIMQVFYIVFLTLNFKDLLNSNFAIFAMGVVANWGFEFLIKIIYKLSKTNNK